MLTRILNAGQAPSGDQDWKRRITQAPSARRFRSRVPLKVGIVTAVVYLLLGTAWAFASPVFVIPDEYSHAVKAAAVVRGDVFPSNVALGESVEVPSWLASTSWKCFAGKKDATADCQAHMTQSTSLTTQVTSAGRYPPFYYSLVGWPTLVFAGAPAFYVQREITVLVSALLLGLAAWSASTTLRSGRVLLALGITVTPMTIYFMGGVNPQAPEIAAAAGVWISGWALLQSRSEFNSGVMARLTISACALALCRPLSVLWLALIVASLLIGFSHASHWVVFRRSLSAKFCAGVIVSACLVQSIWVGSTGALTQSTLGVKISTMEAITTSLYRQVSGVAQMIGLFGSFETKAPSFVYLVWLVAGTCFVLTALLLGSTRERLALVLVIASSVVIPTAAEAATREQTGFPWQGRYTLPLAIGVLLMSGMIASRRFRSTADGLSWDHIARIVVPLVGFAQFLAWASVLKRYSLGASSSFPFGDYIIKWTPPGGVWIWIIFMGISSGLFMLWLLWVTATLPDDEASSLVVMPPAMAVPRTPPETVS